MTYLNVKKESQCTEHDEATPPAALVLMVKLSSRKARTDRPTNCSPPTRSGWVATRCKIETRDPKKKKPPQKDPPQPAQEQHEGNWSAHQHVPPTRPGIARGATARLVPKRNVLIWKNLHQDDHRQIRENDDPQFNRRGIQYSASLGNYPIESGTVRSGYNSGVDKMAGYSPEPKNRTVLCQDEKRDNDQITRENGQIADQRAQLIFSQHQALNRRKDEKRRPNDQYGEKRALDAPSFIRLDKTQRLFQPERRTAIEDFSVGAICLSHFR